MKTRWLGAWAVSVASLSVLGGMPKARAGGYDTPVLYSARHMGMGGTAVGYVDDPSALFHNPAGLQGTKRWSVIGNVSPVFGKLRATPNDPSQYESKDIKSATTVAPFFLVGGAYRVHERVTLGVGVYPVASSGAEYTYRGGLRDLEYTDRTKLVFIEAAPGISVQLPARVTLGATYRLTYVNLERSRTTGQSVDTDFEMSGVNLLGFKLGAQWQPLDSLKLGLTYRHKTVTTVENDKGKALTLDYEDISTKFTLPSRFTAGARYDFDALPLGVAADVEYALNSQNKHAPFVGDSGGRGEVPNVFNWTNAWTLRAGAEYRLLDRRLPLRIGGLWDQKTANSAYPTAFGTPPGATYAATAGIGWDGGDWQVNGAGAYRWGTGKTTIANDADGHAVCRFCGFSGDKDYAISMVGVYLDASVNFD